MSKSSTEVDWDSLRAVILDVDGTLYDQGRLRSRMAAKLASHFLTRPWSLNDLYILYRFRKMREQLSEIPHSDVESTQYSTVAEALGCSRDRVKSVVSRWIYEEPLPLLKDCKYAGVDDFIALLRESGKHVAFYSDYPLAEKLEAMGISSDCNFCATDPSIDQLKPSPRGLTAILDKLGLEARECLMIGDRYERDGRSAESVGMPYIIIGKGDKRFYPSLIEGMKGR